MSVIEEVATLTSKGQITLPKPVRQALGVGAGGKVSFRIDGSRIVVTRAAATAHIDPAIGGFLALIERDLSRGERISALPPVLAKSLKRALARKVDRTEEIEGEVGL